MKKTESNYCSNSVPFNKFKSWFEKAKSNSKILEPTAMSIATINENMQPSLRMVLLKKFDQNGFCFFTNLTSKKGRELLQNNKAALCFYWHELGYQIRIEGSAELMTQKESDDYFSSRRRGSQIGAWASKQSSEMSCWSDFEQRLDEVSKEFQDQEITRPPFWSGFRIVPNLIEFWQEGDYRIHKREVYYRHNKGWTIKKLYP